MNPKHAANAISWLGSGLFELFANPTYSNDTFINCIFIARHHQKQRPLIKSC